MRAEGALCVADEVQCGFGRHGSHFWAFEEQRVVPDVVTLGKPIGNGFPMGAVVSLSSSRSSKSMESTLVGTLLDAIGRPLITEGAGGGTQCGHAWQAQQQQLPSGHCNEQPSPHSRAAHVLL